MDSLKNHFLVAMPMLNDPNFSEAVTYIWQHSDEEGAVGIVVNRPGANTIGEICAQLDISFTDDSRADLPVLTGGPVEPARGFVLHGDSPRYESTVSISDEIFLTASRDILEDIATGGGPKRAIVALGYAGWEAGQLEAEIAANAWLVVEARPEIIFDTPYEQRWAAAANLIGVDIHGISSYSGHA
jgi:putative transcriptional regulator